MQIKMNLIIKLLKNKYGIFVIYLLATWILYFQTVDAGFVTDWTGWQQRYEAEDWSGVLHCFGEPILHQVLHFFSYLMFDLFGTNPLPWFLCFTILHGLNATLFHQLAFRLLKKFEVKNFAIIPWFAAFIFLASPYQTEVVVWKVCLHYLMVVAFALAALHHFLSYVEESKTKDLLGVHIYTVLGLFTIELGLMTPFLVLTVFLIYILRFEIKIKNILLKVILPQFALLFGYFMLNRLLFNDWVGHYGGAAHLNFDLTVWVGGLLRYFVKHLGYIHYFSFPTKRIIYEFLVNDGVYIGYGLIVLLIVVFLLRIKKMSNWALLSFWSLAGFVIVVLPIVNLHFMYILHVENDRYGYWPAMFLGFFVSILAFQLPKWLRYPLLIAYIGYGITLTYETNTYWQNAGIVQKELTNDFRWYDKDEVIVLASPEDFGGVMLFRIIGEESELVYCLEFLRRKPYNGRLVEAAQYNMYDKMDDVNVEWIDSTQTIHVAFNQKGNWFWRNGIGASDYENDLFSIDFQEGWHYYMTLKSYSENRVFIYPKDGKWAEFEIPKE
jgi:hypothetical protein